MHPLTPTALAHRARGLSYEQIARKMGIKRQRARYLINLADPEWVARRAAYSAAHMAEIKRNAVKRRRIVAAQFGSHNAYCEARREAYAVAERDGLCPEAVMRKWGLLDIPGAAGAYLRRVGSGMGG